MTWQLLTVVHLALVGGWFGSLIYSLGVVQPAVARYLADVVRREELLTTLAHGNRWKVVPVAGAVVVTAAAVALTAPGPVVTIGYGAALALYLPAAAILVHVSWRHWPARVFALPEELPCFQCRLRLLAWIMLGLVGAAFATTLVVSVLG